MKFSLRLLESDSKISKLIMDDIKDKIDLVIKNSLSDISREIKELVSEALRNQPEYTSLMAGTLKAEFGIPDSSSVNAVIDALVSTLEIKNNPIKITNNGITGGFTLTMIKSNDINGIIYDDIASVNDAKGYSLPWLEWLLLKGNETLVKIMKYRTNHLLIPDQAWLL